MKRAYTVSGNRFSPRQRLRLQADAEDQSGLEHGDLRYADPGCETRAGVRLRDSHSVGITGNSFSGANSVFSADGLSAGITSRRNTTD